MSRLVLKVGGRVSTAEGALRALPALRSGASSTEALDICIVHGGGADVSRWMERLALPVRFKNGLRVTDEPTLELAIMALRGTVSAGLVRDLAAIGVQAVGLSGLDGGLIHAIPHPDSELGAVGEVESVHPALLYSIFALHMIPLVAPLALDSHGEILNINADTFVRLQAPSRKSGRVSTDVPGVLDAEGRLLSHLTPAQIERLIEIGVIRGGMIPKVRACLSALHRGARAVCIADGRSPTVLKELLAGDPGAGTIIEEERDDKHR